MFLFFLQIYIALCNVKNRAGYPQGIVIGSFLKEKVSRKTEKESFERDQVFTSLIIHINFYGHFMVTFYCLSPDSQIV